MLAQMKPSNIAKLVLGVVAVGAIVAGEVLGWGLSATTVSMLTGLVWLSKSPIDMAPTKGE